MRALIVMLFLALLPGTLGVVDLLNPAQGTTTSQATIDFEYYVSLPNLTGCALRIADQTFPDTDAQSNAMNLVQIQNIASGAYIWNVTCSGTTQETSVSRTLTIDATPPTLVVVTPTNGSTASHLAFDIIPADDTSSTLACTVSWNGQQVAASDVTSNTHFTGTYAVQPGNGTFRASCTDAAGNAVTKQRTMAIEPNLFLTLRTDKDGYGIGEPVQLTVDTLPGAQLTIDICPNQQGFVQCSTALIDNSHFPQTITLPYMNKTGEYIVDAVASLNGDVRSNRTAYAIANTITVSVDADPAPRLNETSLLTAKIAGGAPPYSITWRHANGTVVSGVSSVDVRYTLPGQYNVSVTATDAAGNARTVNTSLIVLPIFTITFTVKDNATNVPIAGADIDFAGQQWTTLQDGLAFFDVPEGRHRLFASAAGYDYSVQELFINASLATDIRMISEGGGPTITVLQPIENGTLGTPSRIRYAVAYDAPLTCTLLKGTDTNWFLENGTMVVSDEGVKEFVRNYAEGVHRIRIECVSEDGTATSTPVIEFAVASIAQQPVAEPAPVFVDDELFLQQAQEMLSAILDGLPGYNQDEQRAIEVLGFDKQVRKAKQSVQQAIRDLDALRFRQDLDDAGRQRERERIVQEVRAMLDATPRAIRVQDQTLYSAYVEEEHLDEVLEALNGLAGLRDSSSVRKRLLDDQQKFTISTKLMHVEYTLPDDSRSVVTLVSREFVYADNLPDGYAIIEILPKEVIGDASDIDLITRAEVLDYDPVLRFETEQRITYVLPKKVDFTRMENVRTLLVGSYDPANSITGLAILDGLGELRRGWVLGVFAAFILIYLGFRMRVAKHVRYLVYRLGRNEQMHYLRVLTRDVEDNLNVGNYQKAEMIYKEIRMTYDTLSDLAKNDLYDEVMSVVHAMDARYFETVMSALEEHVTAGDLEGAIDEYEKLLGTYERLDEERQRQLIEKVTTIAKRLGVSA